MDRHAGAVALLGAIAFASACTLLVDTNDLNRYVPPSDVGDSSTSDVATTGDGSNGDGSSTVDGGEVPDDAGCAARVGAKPSTMTSSVIFCDDFDNPAVATLEQGGWAKGDVSTRPGSLVTDQFVTKPRAVIIESGKDGVKGRASSFRQFPFPDSSKEAVLHLRLLLEPGFEGLGFGIFFPAANLYLGVYPANGDVAVYNPNYIAGPVAAPVNIKTWTHVMLAAQRKSSGSIFVTIAVGEGASEIKTTKEVPFTKDLGSTLGIELGNSNDENLAVEHVDDVWVEYR